MAVAVWTSFEMIADGNGVPHSGALVTVYAAGTTTPLAVYSDKDLSVPASNPIVCDGNGQHPMRYIAAAAYKTIVATSAGETLQGWSKDNVDPGVPLGTGVLAIENGGTGASDAPTALVNLGAATTAQITSLSEDVAELAGAVGGTDATRIATGTTAQRPTTDLVEGLIRRNTTTHRTEGYNDQGTWEQYVTDTQTATQSDMETGTSTTTWVSPGRQHFHKSACKAWATVQAGVSPSVLEGYNISASVTRNGTGDYTFTFSTAMSTSNYAVVGTVFENSVTSYAVKVRAKTTTTVRLQVIDAANGNAAEFSYSFLVFGDI